MRLTLIARWIGLRTHAALAVFALGATACDPFKCKDSVQVVAFAPIIDNGVYTPVLVLWPGDTYSVTANAGGDETNEFCPGHVMYVSSVDPTKFEFTTSNSPVAQISPSGRVTAVGLGTAELHVRAYGIAERSPIEVQVAPPIAQMHYTANPPVGRVGDTVIVTLHPIGPDSLPVTSPAISPMSLTGPNVPLSPWLKGFVATTENSFVPGAAGQYRVTTQILRTGHPSFTVALQYNVNP